MNQMDENYWQKLAEEWIKRQQNEIPEAPKISYSETDKKNYDNLAVADMEIEDVKEEQQPSGQIWANEEHPAVFSNIQLQQLSTQLSEPFPSSSSKFNKKNETPRRSFSHQLDNQLVIPEPPSISLMHAQFKDHLNSIDMDMADSDNEDDSNSAGSFNMMEIAKHKKLPIWLREGLEKMKREKELEQARIIEEQKRKQDEENRKRIMEEALKEIEREKKFSKSKYESSDSETEETDSKTPQQKVEPNENDEEAYENMMLLVRKTLTSILLEVTDEKIQEISNETLSKYRKKASETTKPALMKLGLGAYSSSTEDDDSGDENVGNNSDWESESVIKERIRLKQITFEKRIKERLERHQSDLDDMEKFKRRNSSSKSEAEQSKHSMKAKYSDSDDDKQKFKSSRKDGEEKFETQKYEIYSISKSSGPIVRVPREKRTRFSDPKDGRSTSQMTHLGMVDSKSVDNGTAQTSKVLIQPPPAIVDVPKASESPKKEKKDKKKRRSTSSSSSSSDSGHRKKHKKHKKSSKHSKKSSKKKDRSRSREREKRNHSSRHDRHSVESKTSMRSSESSRRRSRSRSRSRDRHRSRY